MSSATLVVAPVAAIVSCGQNKNYGDLWHGSHRDVVVYSPSVNGQNTNYGSALQLEAPLSFLASTSMGNALNSQILGLFNKVKDGFDKYNEIKSKTKIDGKEVETVKIKADFNRGSHLEFALVKAVKLNFKDNTNEIFDKDINDKNDDKSINGKHFQDVLDTKTVSNIEFIYKDDFKKHHWIQQISGKQMDSFKVEDIWTGIKISSFLNDRTRKNDLENTFGSTEGDKVFKKINALMAKESDDKNRFQETKETTPPSFYETPGTYKLTKDQFRISNKKNVINEKNKTFKLSFDGDQTNQAFKSFWKTNFMSNGGFFAYSTGEIKRLIRNKENKLKAWASANGIDFNKFKNTEVYKSGVIQRDLTKNEKDHEVGGHYYVSLNGKKSFQVNQNLNYIDERWLNLKNKKGEKTTLNSMRYEFIQKSPLAPTIMNEAYFQGFNVGGSIKALSASELQKALSNQKQYGIMHTSGYTASKMIGDYSAMQFLPTFGIGDELDKDGKPKHKSKPKYVFFNDNYAKLLWGHNIKELYKKADIGTTDKASTKDFVEKLFGGPGIQFISSLMAAVNSYTFVKETSTTLQESTTLVAPEGPITGKDFKDGTHAIRYLAHPPTTSTPDDLLHISLRDRNAVKTLSGSGNYTLTTVSREEYSKQFTKAGLKANERYGAPKNKLDILKNNIKEALDAAGIGSNEKVTWELPIGRGETGPTKNPIYEQFRKFIDSLDPRLNMVAEMNPYTEEGVLHGSSEVVQKEFTLDFTLDKKTGDTKKWVKRINGAGMGYSISSLKLANAYKVSSPAAPLLQTINYLQNGELLALSYYSDKNSKISGTKLESLNIIIKTLKDEMKNMFEKNSSNTWADLKSTDKQTIIDTFKNWKFEDIYKAGPADISSYDYIGLGGLEKIRKLKQTKTFLDKTNKDLVKDIRIVMDKVNEWFENALFLLDIKMTSTMSQADIMKTIVAFNIIQPSGFNPGLTTLGNRNLSANGLAKNWYHNPLSDSNGFDDISWIRVDTD